MTILLHPPDHQYEFQRSVVDMMSNLVNDCVHTKHQINHYLYDSDMNTSSLYQELFIGGTDTSN